MTNMTRRMGRRGLVLGGGAAVLLAGWRAMAGEHNSGRAGAQTDPGALGTTPAGATPMTMPMATPAAATMADTGVGGLYLTISNGGAAADALLGGTAAVCQQIEPHTMTMSGGIMTMTLASDGLPVPAGGTLTLTPDGDHLMLINLTQDLLPGTSFPVTLRFRDAGEVAVTAQVRWAPEPSGGMADPPPVAAGGLTVSAIWSRPAPKLSDG